MNHIGKFFVESPSSPAEEESCLPFTKEPRGASMAAVTTAKLSATKNMFIGILERSAHDSSQCTRITRGYWIYACSFGLKENKFPMFDNTTFLS